MPETYEEQLSRVRLMSEGDQQWDLSDNDQAALKAVLEKLDELESRRSWQLADRTRAPDVTEAAWDAATTIVAMWDDVERCAEDEDDPLDFHEWQVAAVVQGAIDIAKGGEFHV